MCLNLTLVHGSMLTVACRVKASKTRQTVQSADQIGSTTRSSSSALLAFFGGGFPY